MFKSMVKKAFVLAAALFMNSAFSENIGKQLADLDDATALVQKKMGLEQARLALAQLSGTGGKALPQIIALYGSRGDMRALLDLQDGGVREIRKGDMLSDQMVVGDIDGRRGVPVLVGKSTFYLPMKSVAKASQEAAQQGLQNQMSAPGYQLGAMPMSVPPLQAR